MYLAEAKHSQINPQKKSKTLIYGNQINVRELFNTNVLYDTQRLILLSNGHHIQSNKHMHTYPSPKGG